MTASDPMHTAMGAFVQNLGALVPLGAALIGITIWLNGEFKAVRDNQVEQKALINHLILCITAREANPTFKCPPFQRYGLDR